MCRSKPLSYDSLRTVMVYMEPNFRIRLSAQIPMLRATDRALPLRLNRLDLSFNSIQINDVLYSLGVTCFEKGTAGKWRIIRKLGACTVDSDFDKNGIPLPHAEPTPGDLSFEEVSNNLETEEQVMENLNRYSARIADGESNYWNSVLPMQDAQRRIEQYREKEENLEPSFKHFLHLIISNGGESVHEFVEYNRNLREALKYLSEKILGRRVFPIKVKTLNVTPKKCIRLPENWMKLDVEHLKVESMEPRLEIVRPILAPASFPLKSITVHKYNAQDIQMLETAETVEIDGYYNQLVPVPFHRVQFNYEVTREGLIVDFVRSWREEKKVIGSCFSFYMYRHTAERAIDVFKAQQGVVVRENAANGEQNRYRFNKFPQVFIFPIDAKSEIALRCLENSSESSFRVRLEMKVQSTKTEEIRDPIMNAEATAFSENCQKSIIENMDPCFRLYLSRNNSEFSKLEKSIPLKIEHLSFNYYSLTINNAHFSMRLERFDKTENGKLRKVQPWFGWIYNDVDKYGIRIPPVLNSEDLIFGSEEEKDEKSEVEELNEKLAVLKEELANEADEEIQIRKQDAINHNRFKFNRFLLRQQNLEPDYCYLFELCIGDSSIRKEETIDTQGKFYNARRYLFDKILGNRSGFLNVKNLTLVAHDSVLSIPKNLKILAKNVTIKGNQNGLKIFESILDDFDFESIGLDHISKTNQESDIEILNKSKTVVFTSDFKNAILPSLPFKNVKFSYFSMDHFSKVLMDWQQKKPALGTVFTFVCNDWKEQRWMGKIAKMNGAFIGEVAMTKFGPSSPCVIFPLNESFEIVCHIFEPKRSQSFLHHRGPHLYHHFQEERYYRKQIIMRITEKGFATPNCEYLSISCFCALSLFAE